MDRYAVIGHPVAHSLSPTIHARFAAQTGQALEYGRIDAPADGFATAASGFFATGGRGLNVTVPFKAKAFAWSGRASERAARARVVNTLTATADGTVEGDNTDGTGLVRDLTVNLGLGLAGTRILLVGAGGAARGVTGPLLEAGPGALVVANRTAERAQALAEAFGDTGPVHGCGFDALCAEAPFDVVINATAASLGGELPPLPDSVVGAGGTVYDMMYGEPAHPFLDWGRRAGAVRAVDGLGMLVEQAAESFRIWRGARPDTDPVLAELRRAASTRWRSCGP